MVSFMYTQTALKYGSHLSQGNVFMFTYIKYYDNFNFDDINHDRYSIILVQVLYYELHYVNIANATNGDRASETT